MLPWPINIFKYKAIVFLVYATVAFGHFNGCSFY